MKLLSEQQVEEKLSAVNGWRVVDGKQIEKEIELKDFMSALEFVNKVGAEAEKMNHHPDILIHSWNKVKLAISSHDEGGITEKDFTLASEIDGLTK